MAAQDPPAAPARHRRRLPPADRRRELLDAAVRVLRQRGPDNCRVSDITAAAGTAKGNFYRYFPAGAFASTDEDATARLIFHLLHGAADEIAAGGDRQRIQQAVLTIIHRTLDLPNRARR